MRLLLVNHFPLEGSGSGVYTKNIAYRMLERGYEVRVIAVDNKKIKKNSYPFPVTTLVYPQFPCFTTHPGSDNNFYDLSREEMNEYFNRFKNVIKKVIYDFKPDLIHCQHLWVAPFIVEKFNIPYVITAHGTDIKGFKRDLRYRNAALKGAKGSEYVITISRRVHKQVKKYYNLKEDKLKLIWNGFDEKLFYKKEEVSEQIWENVLPEIKDQMTDSDIVSFVGKLTHFKGVDLLLEAGKYYEKKRGNIKTLITGDGELLSDLKRQSKKLELQNFFFLGNQPQSVVADINNIASVAVVPSRDEPFGLVAIEALACGTPVVASDTGGLKDFVTDEVGRLFPEGESKALGKAIINSLEENDKEKKGPIAIRYARENFSWGRVADELENLYMSALERRNG